MSVDLKRNLPLALVGLFVLFVMVKTNAPQWVGTQLIAPLEWVATDMPYATRMADMIIDWPQCDRFRQAILSAGKGPPASGSPKGNIINAYEDAKRSDAGSPRHSSGLDVRGVVVFC